jgi:hypothetical protein
LPFISDLLSKPPKDCISKICITALSNILFAELSLQREIFAFVRNIRENDYYMIL